MKGFQINIPDRIFNKLKKFPKNRQKQILNKMGILSKTPELLDIRKMEDSIDTYRLRIGSYRVIFIVDYANKTINIERVGTKSKIEKYY